jgi:hypothetical protein
MKKNLVQKEFGMTYFPDLTPYTYLHRVNDGTPPTVTTLNIGWLGREKPFQLSSPEWPDQVFLDNLSLYEQEAYLVNRMRGWHICELCEGAVEEYKQDWKKCYEEGKLCHDELRVLGSDGVFYAAPSILRHYITVHQYRPAEQFIQAVLHGPRPSSRIYDEAWTQSSLT